MPNTSALYRNLVPVTTALFALTGCPRSTPSSVKLPVFDGQQALRHVAAQVELGPRFTGRPGHAAALDYYEDHLLGCGLSVERRPFTLEVHNEDLTFTNLVAFWPKAEPPRAPRVLLAAHFDSRPWADQDPDPAHRNQPIDGANDGASGVAVLLELARTFAAAPPPIPIELVFFDGEDHGPSAKDMFLGSNVYAGQLQASDYRFGILLDMIGDADLQIYQERWSVHYAPELVELVWNTARELGFTTFHATVRHSIMDDHLPLNRAGVKCIDLIDFDYPAWHTLEDTLDKVSATSLEQVGTVVLHVLHGLR